MRNTELIKSCKPKKLGEPPFRWLILPLWDVSAPGQDQDKPLMSRLFVVCSPCSPPIQQGSRKKDL